MNEEIVGMVVRLACGESSEPPVVGVVETDGNAYRIWKHGERMRVETLDGALQSIREPERLLRFHEGDDLPVESSPREWDFDVEDTPWIRVHRPRLERLRLGDRSLDVRVQHGVRFGRRTVAFALEGDLSLTLVLDAETGMPFEMVDEDVVLRWRELEVVETIDEGLLTWRGDTRVGWFAYVGVSGGEGVGDSHLPPGVRDQFRELVRREAELAREIDLPELTGGVRFGATVTERGPGEVGILLNGDAHVSIEGRREHDPDESAGMETWTTEDGWSWSVRHHGLCDTGLLDTVREAISAWRGRVGRVEPD